jgi:ubiquinone/menaquinone biosynthesis C-methylase UbiE
MVRHSPVYQALIADTLGRAAIARGDECVDLGCGPGYLALELLRCGGRVTAIDYSAPMLEQARSTLSRYFDSPNAAPRIDLVLADVHEWLSTRERESSDVVVASLLLAYLPEPERVVEQVQRVLRPRGRFVMSNPVPEARFSRIFWRSGWNALRYLPYALRILRHAAEISRLERLGVFHFFSREETTRMLTSSGFADSGIEISPAYAGTCLLTRAVR